MNLITEGAITFETEGAFYNPKMLLNRDIGVAMARPGPLRLSGCPVCQRHSRTESG